MLSYMQSVCQIQCLYMSIYLTLATPLLIISLSITQEMFDNMILFESYIYVIKLLKVYIFSIYYIIINMLNRKLLSVKCFNSTY